MDIPNVEHRHVDIDGLSIFYRAVGPKDAMPVLLLHGFPSGSHQFRRLLDALGSRHRLIAPDYPGFGHSDAPAPANDGGSFVYSFDSIANVMERFCEVLGLRLFLIYMFDYGGPIGLRLAARHPERIAGLIIQNANAYEVGLSPMARGLAALRPGAAAEAQLNEVLTLQVTRGQYLGGTAAPELVAPDGWILDQGFLELPGRKRIQTILALDYHSNVERYSEWQAWLRRHRPPTLILWGRSDAFFPEAGALAYLKDLPEAELHLFDTGHFALEEKLPEIAPLIARFVARVGNGRRVVGLGGPVGP
jgi:pimeloyl-ACP methyl ester carboxylesterase